MEPRKDNFAIAFDPRQSLLRVSLVVECGLGGGPGRRRYADSPAQTRSNATAARRSADSPSRLARLRLRAARTRSQKHGA